MCGPPGLEEQVGEQATDDRDDEHCRSGADGHEGPSEGSEHHRGGAGPSEELRRPDDGLRGPPCNGEDYLDNEHGRPDGGLGLVGDRGGEHYRSRPDGSSEGLGDRNEHCQSDEDHGVDDGDDMPGIPSLAFLPMSDMDAIRAASRKHRRIMDDAAEAFDYEMFEMAGIPIDDAGALGSRPAPETGRWASSC